ncbi:DNA-binding transcriptional regulator, HxlR family [Thermomonospora echinospora]|uniref:DNA-binding transcriptional regulator, HxlR family n=1 Tax=Thermomonospora echinospora TaxID=1992 RepID=A0A1H6DA13_9ACTN|nr:helix-turn-helix domain-containing protein [Thermomonospora echinospora]SEG81376.1 DNA-binding transcriptional regulator, HxlR family [Thermomonospora echinospora]
MAEQTFQAPQGPFRDDCPSRTVLNHVANRWGTLIIASLHEGPMRFHLLRDHIGGISEKMLAQNLRLLARDGLIERTVQPTTPPQVSYALTPLGLELADHLRNLVGWITCRTDEIVAARERYDSAQSR